MDKEEILNKSRQSKKDEGLEYIENKGRKIGHIAFCCVFIFIVLFNIFRGQQSFAIYALFWAFFAADALPKYQFTHKKSYLVVIVAGAIASIANLVNFILESLG